MPVSQQPPNPQEIVMDNSSDVFGEMRGFLARQQQFTVLPTPLPHDVKSKNNDLFFIDTPTQDSVAIVNACVHNLHDVPRAKQVFDLLRSQRMHDPVLSIGVYNSVLKAYLGEAGKSKQPYDWIENACALYEAMEQGYDRVAPSAGTYAIMMQAWMRFNLEAEDTLMGVVGLITPEQLLEKITNRNIPISLVISDKTFESSEEAEAAIKLWSKAAVDMNMSKVVSELGAAEILGRQRLDVDDVPEVMPVLKRKVCIYILNHLGLC